MSYIDGYLVPVAVENTKAYREGATRAAALFKEFGATRVLESWTESALEGKVAGCESVAIAENGENVVFSWIEWPSKTVRDAGYEKSMSDPRMLALGDVPFNGNRVIHEGFETPVEA